jgi:hypothetical protein
MFSRLKNLFVGGSQAAAVAHDGDRQARYEAEPAPSEDAAVPYTGGSSAQPRHVLCILGGDRDLQPLRAAANAAIAEFATGFSVDETYSQAEPDQHMSRSFSVCWDRVEPNAWTTADEEAVSAHQSVLYVVGPRMTRDDAVAVSIGALFLIDRLVKAGAVAVKGESAGTAHGLHRWRELIRMGAAAMERDHALAQSRVCRWAFAKRPLSSGDHLESVGFHLAGLPDVHVPTSRGSEREIVALMDQVADQIAEQGIDAALRAYDASLIDDRSYEEDDFKFNPYGIVKLRS